MQCEPSAAAHRRHPLLPASRSAREPRGQRRLDVRRRFRFRLSRRGADLPFEFRFVGQTCELVRDHQGVLRRDLESLPAGLARDLVIETEQIVACFCELGPVLLARSSRQPVFLRSADPPNAVFGSPTTPEALIPSGSGFRFLREHVAFVKGHSAMVATNGDAGVRDRGRASSPHARAACAGALQGLDGRPLDRNLAALCDRYGSPEAAVAAVARGRRAKVPGLPDRREWPVWIAAQMRAAVECLQDESPHFPDVPPRVRSSLTIAPSCGYRRANLAHAGCGGRIGVRTVGNPRGTVGNPPCSKGPQRGTAWSGTRYVAQVVGRINRVIRVERWPLRRSAPCDSPFIYKPSWDVAVVLFCLGGALISGMGVMLGFRQNRPGPRPNYGRAERCMTLLAGVLQ